MEEEIIAITKVLDKGKVQIPAEIRKILDIKDGDKIIWYLRGDTAVIRKRRERQAYNVIRG